MKRDREKRMRELKWKVERNGKKKIGRKKYEVRRWGRENWKKTERGEKGKWECREGKMREN